MLRGSRSAATSGWRRISARAGSPSGPGFLHPAAQTWTVSLTSKTPWASVMPPCRAVFCTCIGPAHAGQGPAVATACTSTPAVLRSSAWRCFSRSATAHLSAASVASASVFFFQDRAARTPRSPRPRWPGCHAPSCAATVASGSAAARNGSPRRVHLPRASALSGRAPLARRPRARAVARAAWPPAPVAQPRTRTRPR